jgi:hypothetical protein
LGWVGNTVGKICFIFDFIIYIACTVDACALTSILPTLSLIDMIYFTADTKATPASAQGVRGSLSLVVKWPEREADHLPPSSAELKNA